MVQIKMSDEWMERLIVLLSAQRADKQIDDYSLKVAKDQGTITISYFIYM